MAGVVAQPERSVMLRRVNTPPQHLRQAIMLQRNIDQFIAVAALNAVHRIAT
jgi:hypothetical protein